MTLNVIDDFNREAIAIEVAHSMPAVRVTWILEQVICEQGKQKYIRVDNEPEFISKEFYLVVHILRSQIINNY